MKIVTSLGIYIGLTVLACAQERYAIIDSATGRVENVILSNGTPADLPPGMTVRKDDKVAPGWSLLNGVLTPPAPPPPLVPQVVSRLQGLVAMQRAGILDAVKAWVASQGGETQLIFESLVEFRRDSNMLEGARSALNMTDAQVDDLFKAAASIQP